jgi:hypothetical protein
MTHNIRTKEEVNNLLLLLFRLKDSTPEYDVYQYPVHRGIDLIMDIIKDNTINSDLHIQFRLDDEEFCGQDEEFYLTKVAFDALEWKQGEIEIDELLHIKFDGREFISYI